MTTLITIYAIIQRVFGQNRRQQPRLQTVVAYAHVSRWVSCKLSNGSVHLWCEAGWTGESIL